MRMHKVITLLSIVIMASSLFACNYFEELLGTGLPDLTVVSVTALTDSTTGVINDVQTVLENQGTKAATGVEYEVVLTADTTVSASDLVVYKATLDLAIGAQKQVDITNTQISQYMTANSISAPADGKYYYGVWIDPSDKIAEKDETNNTEASSAWTWYIGGLQMAYAVQGTITVPSNLTYDGATAVPGGGANYTIYCFAMLQGTTPVSGTSVNMATLDLPGMTKWTITYYGGQTTVPTYTCGIPVSGSYVVIAFMDVVGNGIVQLSINSSYNGQPVDPYGCWKFSNGPQYQSITDDVSGADMTLFDGVPAS